MGLRRKVLEIRTEVPENGGPDVAVIATSLFNTKFLNSCRYREDLYIGFCFTKIIRLSLRHSSVFLLKKLF